MSITEDDANKAEPERGKNAIIPYSEIKMKNAPDLPDNLTSKMEHYADLLVLNPHLSPIDAYQKAYGCDQIGAAKNYRRVYTRPEFKRYISVMKSAITEHIGITEEQIIHILALRAKNKITDIAKWDARGNVEYIPSEELPEGAALSIEQFEVLENPILDANGDPKYDKGRLLAQRKIKIKMRGADKPIEMLGRYLGIWEQEDPATDRRMALLEKFMNITHGKKTEDK